MAAAAHFFRWIRPLRDRLDGMTRAARRPHAVRRMRGMRPEVGEGRAQLTEFGRRSGHELTALAESIMRLAAELAEVRVQAERLDHILHDQDEDCALAAAFELYKKSIDLTHSSIGLALTQESQLESIEGNLLRNRGQFQRSGLMFQILVMNLRTEAARVDPENRDIFTSVADDIAAMQRQMDRTVEVAFAQLEAIVSEAANGRSELKNLQQTLHGKAEHSRQALQAVLGQIKSGLAPCAARSSEVGRLLLLTRDQTAGLITALQYQDIVSQQLEHVGQGFEDIVLHLEPAGPKADVDLGYLHHAARVQQIHLRSSRKTIDEAGRQIGQGCQALLSTGAALVRGLTDLEQATNAVFNGIDAGAQFKDETENLLSIAGLSESTNSRIARLLERIEDSVRVFSTEISGHEFGVQLVALNAQIAAARVPQAGALNKLAEEIAHHSGDTAQLTRDMSAQLRETLARLQEIRAESMEVQAIVGRDKAAITGESILVAGKLAQLNERIRHGSSAVAREFGKAYAEVQGMSSALRFPSLIDSSYSPAESLCDCLLASCAPFAADTLSAEGADRLAAHHGRYTMQGERQAHAAVVASAPAAGSETGPGPVDSIELFDPAPAGDPPAVSGTPAASNHHASPAAPGEKLVAAGTVPGADDGVELF